MSLSSPCPHCRAKAAIEPSSFLRWRCAVCGGPIVPTEANETAPRSGAELADLVRAQRVRAGAIGWTACAILFVAIMLLAGGLGGLLWRATPTAGLLLEVIATASLAVGIVAWRRARAGNAAARSHLDAAWETVAREELLAGRGTP